MEKPANKNPKKTNLLDHNSIKHILDESVTEVCEFLTHFRDHFCRMLGFRHFFSGWIGRISLDYESFSLFWL